jgi:tetracycline 7-halogenase / FADH2 O2-dependent halogenase
VRVAATTVRALRRPELNEIYDIAVVGSGFAGSLLAMIARRLGRSVILIEKGTHPRVVIGESSTPLSNLLLEELAIRYGLDELRAFTKWGSWQKSHLEIACGLKRGFTFHHHVLGVNPSNDPERRDQLLVAANPRDEIGDTHWYRADFDHFLVREAQRLGVEYMDRVTLRHLQNEGESVALEGQRDGRGVKFHTKFVVDATGPRCFLHHALGLRELDLPDYPRTQGLYSHFSGVNRLQNSPYSRLDEPPPYPVDDAAVHHVFDGGWIWVLQFNNGVTSAGVAATDELASQLRFADGEEPWKQIVDMIPALKQQFATARALIPFVHMPRMAFRSSAVAGEKWAMLPSAAGFVDPLLSTGIPLTLLGISRIGEIIEQYWSTERFGEKLQVYAAQTDRELTATARLIGALYANMNNFPVFVALTLLYFAAASFSETARRLGKPHLAKSFLLCDDPVFGPVCARMIERSRQRLSKDESIGLINDIHDAIEPINVAGLGRPERRNWYPVHADDVVDASAKLGASREDIFELLRRCGFSAQ